MNLSLFTKILGVSTLLTTSTILPSLQASNIAPAPDRTVAPKLSGELAKLSGEVKLLLDINEFGYVIDAQVYESTQPQLNDASLDAIYQWRFKPSTEDGEAVASRIIQPFYYSDGSIVLKAKKAASDRNPIAKTKVKPRVTDEVRRITGNVVLQANLDVKGAVTSVEIKSSTHSELEEVASAALQKWKFKPAIESGQAVASKVIIPFNFEGTGQSAVIAAAKRTKRPDSKPHPIRTKQPEIPSHLLAHRAETKLKLTIDRFGFVADAQVMESSNEQLSTLAKHAALEWKFKPAIKDGKAVPATIVQPFAFNGGILADDVPVDRLPEVKRSRNPELPSALALVKGYVKVRLSLDDRGNVVGATATQSTHDELVAPTIEAAKKWSFKPAIRDGQKVPSSVTIPFMFNQQS